MKCIKPIFEIIPEDTADGIVSKNNGLEETFLGYCDIQITISINMQNKDAVDMIKLQLIYICKKFCATFAKLLGKADKENQPNRLMF